MTVRPGGDAEIVLEGNCPVEDAEVLLGLLLWQPDASVDWRHCDHAHTAVIQVLMASKAKLRGPPRGPVLRRLEASMIHRR